MENYIFLTNEGYTYQKDSKSNIPDIDNLQVIGFSSGKNSQDAFQNLIIENPYLTKTSFEEIFCYKLDTEYFQTKKHFNLKNCKI